MTVIPPGQPLCTKFPSRKDTGLAAMYVTSEVTPVGWGMWLDSAASDASYQIRIGMGPLDFDHLGGGLLELGPRERPVLAGVPRAWAFGGGQLLQQVPPFFRCCHLKACPLGIPDTAPAGRWKGMKETCGLLSLTRAAGGAGPGLQSCSGSQGFQGTCLLSCVTPSASFLPAAHTVFIALMQGKNI